MLSRNPFLDQDDKASTKAPETLPQMLCLQTTGTNDSSCAKFSDESFTEEVDGNNAQSNGIEILPPKNCEPLKEPRKSFSRVRLLLSHSLV